MTSNAPPLRVLWVEDNVDLLQVLELAIRREPDFEIVAVTSDPGAVQSLVLEHRPDVLIMDHGLAGLGPAQTGTRGSARPAIPMTGLELVEGARSVIPDATIVIFSGRPGLHTAALHAGADLCIEKPDVAGLWPAIRKFRAARLAAT